MELKSLSLPLRLLSGKENTYPFAIPDKKGG